MDWRIPHQIFSSIVLGTGFFWLVFFFTYHRFSSSPFGFPIPYAYADLSCFSPGGFCFKYDYRLMALDYLLLVGASFGLVMLVENRWSGYWRKKEEQWAPAEPVA